VGESITANANLDLSAPPADVDDEVAEPSSPTARATNSRSSNGAKNVTAQHIPFLVSC